MLDDNLISLKLQRLPNDLGNFPPSSFPDKSILMADVRFPMALEIVPYKLLEPRLRNSRQLKLYNQLGIEELKLFPDRSRCLREVVLWRSTIRDEKLTVGVGGMKGSRQDDNRNLNKEGSVFVSCSQSEVLLRFT